jgi:GNAT superfamily N-acetyltransferase
VLGGDGGVGYAKGVTIVRSAEPGDLEAAIAVWRASNLARRGGRPVPGAHETRVRSAATKPDAFLLVAEDRGEIVGVGLGMQGLADDGAGPPVAGLCHVAMVFVVPGRWGHGVGGQIVDTLLAAARGRGYARVQLWTHADNRRAERLYVGRGFTASGRRKPDDLGEIIVHFERAL